MRPSPRDRYSYRTDPAVPAFDESRTVLVMDGECALCSATARRIARLDRADQVRITMVQSDLGAALLCHYGLDAADPATWLMLTQGRAYGSLDAIIRLSARLHVLGNALVVLRVLPPGAQDWLYARVARNRYAVFGRSRLCAMPEPELQRRLLT